MVAWTLNGEPTTEGFQTLLNSSDKIIDSITCKNGTEAKWNASSKSINLSNIQAPDYCTIDFIDYKGPSFIAKLKENNPNITTRNTESFKSAFTGTSGLYVENDEKFIETDGKDPLINEVLYFAGNPNNNWVKFGQESGQDIWWRIIRTNEDGSVRLLYAGKGATGYNTTSGYINGQTYMYNEEYGETRFVGYKYGNSGSLKANREDNLQNSNIKKTIDSWYEKNLLSSFGSYLSRTAIYCNDRATSSYDPILDLEQRIKLIDLQQIINRMSVIRN